MFFPLLLAFDVGGLGFEFWVFVAGWRHALRSEWPFFIIIIITQQLCMGTVHVRPDLGLTGLAGIWPGV